MSRFVLAAFAAALVASSAQAQRVRPDVAPPAGEMFGAAAPRAASTGLPAGFSLETVASGLTVPTGTAFLPDGRMLVVEKEGRLKLVSNGTARLVLDLTAEVLEHGDRGLLGVAVDPRFAQTGWIYLLYTVSPDGREGARTDAFGRVTRYTLAPAGTASGRRVLIGDTFSQGIPTCYYSHSIGTLAFGRDGSLFVGAGDGASYNTADTGGLYPDCFGPGRFPASEDIGAFRSQSLTSLAGKILRVDPATGRGYPSNPFWTGNPDDAASKVWALGFRNPFRFSVDPATGSTDPAAGDPGAIYYGDVGYVAWEEVGVVRRGQNGGWPCREGMGAQSQGGSYPSSALGQRVCPGLSATAPAFAWHHTNAALSVPAGRTGSSVVGGAVYRGTRYPAEYRGRLFYADYSRGWIASAQVAAGGALTSDALFAPDAGPIVDIAYDPSTQNLFLTNVYTGTVQRLRHADESANTPPTAVAAGTPTQGGAPLVVRFTGAGSSDPDGDALAYAWTFGNGQTSTAASPTTTYTAAGDYTARLTVTDSRGGSAQATVAIAVRAGSPPAVAITQPTAGQTVLSGQTLALAGTGTDPDAGQTATLTYAWAITLVHEGHQHPGAFQATGRAASFTVPFHGDAGEHYALLIRLTATDATGFATTAERTVTITTPTGPALGPLPAPWAHADVGPPYGEGSAGVAPDGSFVVAGGGDVWGDVDHFHYVWEPLGGDGTLTARIVGLAGANPWAKAGLMIRASTAGDAPHAMVIATPGNGTHLQFRRAPGGQTEWQPGPARTLPTWLRLVRVGSAVTAYTSADGQVWSPVGSASVALGQTALVGLMATSTDFSGRNDVATATFTDVVLTTGAATGPVADVTTLGTPVALVTAPTGGGARTLAVLRDGIAPAPTTVFPADLAVQYDTYTGDAARQTDWFGYTFAAPLTLARVRFAEGAHFDDGGWFETLGVEVRVGGAWRAVSGLTVAPAYPARNDGRHFDAYDLAFTPVLADGVRIVGRPGGASRFVSVSELRVFGQGAAGAALSDGWTSADVGTVAAPGSATYAGGVFTVRGNGDLWGDADHAHLTSTALSGDGTLTARLDAVDGQNPWAKAGLMIRASTAGDAPHVMLIGTPGRGVHLQYRTAQGGDTGWQAGSDTQRAPVWLRLVRTGAEFSAFVSADGSAFTLVGRTTVAMPDAVLAGLVVASTDYSGRGDLATARFSSVALGVANGLDAPQTAQSRAAPAAVPFAIDAVFPNPARASATIRVGVPAPGEYRAEVLDVLGRRVAEQAFREDAPGMRDVRLDLSGQSAGLYVVRVSQAGGETLTSRLTVVR